MPDISRREGLHGLAALAASPLAACGTWIRDEDVQPGELKGRVLVEWVAEDRFVYRATPGPPLSFRPSFMRTAIVPQDMYTDGGSIPRLFWSIPGLSPWGLGPAYIIHDWLFQVHRCGRPAPPEVRAITFQQSAIILAQVGKALIDRGLIDHDMLQPIVWAVRTRYVETFWDKPGTAPNAWSRAPRGAPAAPCSISPSRSGEAASGVIPGR
jgi:hypothetical protein